MPFTLSHAIVAAPFARTPLPVAAVAIGAMIPDAPLFVTGGAGYVFLHSIVGALLVDLPAAFLVFVLWRALLRPVLRGVVPRSLGERLPAEWETRIAGGLRSVWLEPGPRSLGRGTPSLGRGPVATVLLLVAALVVGVLSHLLWDGFTHPDTWLTPFIPVLDEVVGGVIVATWAHYLSSALGIVGLAAYALWWFWHAPVTPVRHPAPLALRALSWLVALAAAAYVVWVTLSILAG